jgi:hypothetical protein
MIHGGRGVFGIYGNLLSVTYGSDWCRQFPNPTLSASIFTSLCY